MFTFVVNGLFTFLITIILSDVSGKEDITFDAVSDKSSKIVKVLEKSSNVIIVHNVPSYAAALLFEAHSHIEDIILSDSAKTCLQCSVSGRNIGMVYQLYSWESDAHMWLLNKLQKNISVLISITILDSYGPIPGGCNMEFPIEIAPYLRLKSETGRVNLEFQHANIGSFRNEPAALCSHSISYITYDIYVSYMKENDFSETEYFNRINDMNNVTLIKQNSNKMKSYSAHPDTRFSFLMYPNVGVVYNIIAKYTTNGVIKEAAYVPVASYGCGKAEFTEYGCNFKYAFEGKAFLFMLSMYGFITAYFGHLFFGSTMFFFGFLTAFFITFVLTGRFSDLTFSKVAKISGIFSIVGGGIWLFLWLWFHNAVISLLLVGFVLGFLLTATILYTPVGNYEIISNDKNYWLILATGSLLVTVLLLAYPAVLSVLGSSVVGSYIMLLFYDDFMGTRLAFVILNIVKRAISKNLDFAANDYPFGTKDIIIWAAWIVLLTFGIIVQSRSLLSDSRVRGSRLYKLCFCKCRDSERSYSQFGSSPEGNPRQPLCSNDSVFYNTFSK